MKNILLIVLSLSVFGLASIANSQTIRIGTEGAYPPWNNINSAGDLEGAEIDFGNAKCPKFNIVGTEEINNLELAKIIANSQGKELKYKMVDFHSSRPGHDLRYSLSGEKMKKLGWTPSIKLTQRIKQVVEWSLNNENWIEL